MKGTKIIALATSMDVTTTKVATLAKAK